MLKFLKSMVWTGVVLAYLAVFGTLQGCVMYGLMDDWPYKWLYVAGFALWIMLGSATWMWWLRTEGPLK